MLVRYRFVNETVEVEVPDEWGKEMAELDRQEYNNEQRETRRHVSLDSRTYDGEAFGGGVDPADVVAWNDEVANLQKAIASLSSEHRELLQKVLFEGSTFEKFGQSKGVSRSAIAHRLETIYRQLKKFLEDPQH